MLACHEHRAGHERVRDEDDETGNSPPLRRPVVSRMGRLYGAAGRLGSGSCPVTAAEPGRNRRRPPAIPFSAGQRMPHEGRLHHPEGRGHHLCADTGWLVVGDVSQSQNRQRRQWLGQVGTIEDGRDHGAEALIAAHEATKSAMGRDQAPDRSPFAICSGIGSSSDDASAPR